MRFTGERGGFPVGLVLGAGAVAASVVVTLFHLDRLPVTLCVFKAATGIPCATCGSTRAIAHLSHLDVAGAFALNPLATLGVVMVLLWCAADLVLLTRGRALSLELAPGEARVLQVVALFAFVSNWIYVIAAGR